MADLPRYRVVRTISGSGSIEIVEAVALGVGNFERRVAIKRARADHPPDDPDFTQQFLDEARIRSQLHHANLVPVFDFGVDEGGAPYLVMDYVDGLSVGQLVAKAAASGRALTPSLAVHIAREVAHGLAHAHAAVDRAGAPLGIIHRDVAPGNVLVSWAGDVVLTDFGIARSHQRSTQTAAGAAKGTRDFMAPEQLVGGHVDQRVDLYAVGTLLHFMLTGRSVSAGLDTSERAAGARRVDDGLHPEVTAVIQRATAPHRTERHPDARALAADLWRVWLGLGDHADARTSLIVWMQALVGAPQAAHRLGALFDVGASEDRATPVARAPTARVPLSAPEESETFVAPPRPPLSPQPLAPMLDVEPTRVGSEWSLVTDPHETASPLADTAVRPHTPVQPSAPSATAIWSPTPLAVRPRPRAKRAAITGVALLLTGAGIGTWVAPAAHVVSPSIRAVPAAPPSVGAVPSSATRGADTASPRDPVPTTPNASPVPTTLTASPPSPTAQPLRTPTSEPGRRAARGPRTSPSPAGATAAPLVDQLEAALGARGMMRRDLSGSALALLDAFEHAVTADDLDAARAALPPLLAALDVASRSPAVLARRLERLGENLSKAPPTVDLEKVRAVETAYFALRATFPPRAGDHNFAARLRALEQEWASIGAAR